MFFAGFSALVGEGEQGVLLGFRGEPRTVLSIEPPPGAYVIEARLNLHLNTTRDASSFAECSLPDDTGTSVQLDSAERPGVGQNSGDDELEITTAIDHSGGEVALICAASTFQDTAGTTVSNATLLATPVGAVNPGGG